MITYKMKKRLDFLCATHTDEYITNYCCLMGCQTPLCPECIDDHNKRHKANGVYPEIDTLNRVSKMCDKKASVVVNELQEMLERLNSLQCFDIDTVKQTAHSDLQNIKEILINQIESFFDNIYKDFCSKITGSLKKVSFYLDLINSSYSFGQKKTNINLHT